MLNWKKYQKAKETIVAFDAEKAKIQKLRKEGRIDGYYLAYARFGSDTYYDVIRGVLEKTKIELVKHREDIKSLKSRPDYKENIWSDYIVEEERKLLEFMKKLRKYLYKTK